MAVVTGAVVAAGTIANSVYQGKKSREAAKEAARIQSDAAKSAAQLNAEANDRLRSDLSPYAKAGETAIPLLQQFATDPSSQVAALEQNPLFQASLAARDRDTLGAAATQGRIGTGDFSQQTAQNYMLAASPLLQQQEQSLLNLANIGQSSAAQQGVSGLQSAKTIGNLGMQGADARSAGVVAAQQAGANRNAEILNNLPSLVSSIGAMRTTPPPKV